MSRKLAREAAFKALFELDFNYESETSLELAIATMYEDEPHLTSQKDRAYIESRVKGAWTRLPEIDAIISEHLKEGWQLVRLMAVDRNILRLAVYEMKYAEPKIAKGIVINEAVELAKRYGTDESSRFVNGILEAISNRA